MDDEFRLRDGSDAASMLRRRVEQVNLIDLSNREVGVDQIMMLNLKLREDLTSCFQNYLRIMTAADLLQKENIDVKLQLEKAIRADKSDMHRLQAKIQILESQLKDREQQRRTLEIGYERRLEALKKSLEEAQNENSHLEDKVIKLERQNLQDNGYYGSEPSQLQKILQEKAEALLQVEKLQSQVEL